MLTPRRKYFMIPAILMILLMSIADEVASQNIQRNGPLQPLVPDFRVNEKVGGPLQESPWIASRGDLGYVIVWWDWRNGRAIMGQLVDSLGNQIGDNFVIADTLVDDIYTTETKMRVDANANGEFVVVWSAGIPRRTRPSIVACKVRSNGTVDIGPFLVTDKQSAVHLTPDVHLNDDGSFVFVWREDDRPFTTESVWAKWYDSGSQPASDPILLAEPGEDPSISGSAKGEIYVIWNDSNASSSHMFITKYDSSRNLVWGPIQASQVSGNIPSNEIVVAESGVSALGYLRQSLSSPPNDSPLVFRLFNPDGTPRTDELLLNDFSGDVRYNREPPSFSYLDDIGWLVTWTDRRSGIYETWCQLVSHNGETISSNNRISNATKAGSVTIGGNGRGGIVAWQDLKRGQYDIYMRRFAVDSMVTFEDAEIVNHDQDDALQDEPIIAANNQGEVVITWTDRRTNTLQVFGQRLAGIELLGGNLNMVPEALFPRWHTMSMSQESKILIGFGRFCSFAEPKYVKVLDFYQTENDTIFFFAGTCDESGSAPLFLTKEESFIALWSKGQIYVKELDYQGADLSDQVRVNPPIPGYRYPFEIVGNSPGRFAALFATGLNYETYRLFVQRFDSHIVPYDSLLELNVTPMEDFPGAALAMDAQSNLIMVWTKFAGDSANVWAGFLPWNASSLKRIKINQQPGRRDDTRPEVDVVMNDDGNALIVWDSYDGQFWKIMGQSLDFNGELAGQNFPIVDDPPQANHNYPRIAFSKDLLYMVWQDDREAEFSKKYDIYASVFNFDELLVSNVRRNDEVSYDFHLFQNHPNPFNPSTALGYKLATDGHVKLIIYNTMGQEVRVLVDQRQRAGSYEISWEGRDDRGRILPTGVYIYRLTAGSFVHARKMLLMR